MRSREKYRRCWCSSRFLGLFALGALLLAVPCLAAAEDTDVVTLRNGDRLTGEVKSLERGKLRFKTDDMGTVEIEWEKVESLSAEERFEVELTNGEKYFGTLDPSTEPGRVIVADDDGRQSLDLVAIVRMNQVERSFWERLSGDASVGFDFATATQLTQWSAMGRADYRKENYTAHLVLSSILTSQANAEKTTRNSIGLQVNRPLRARWFFTWLGQLEQNEELGLESRLLFGVGVGRHLHQTNRTQLALLGAVGYSRERFQGTDDARNSAESIAGIRYDFFLFDDPEVDVSTQVYVVPS